MADTIQVIMEGMAVELNLLAKSGIFTKTEIRSIVRHRERFEFRTHKPQPSKLDFLRYIQYEQKLEQLRSRRLKRLNKVVNPLISGGGISHIQSIYSRALLKFPTDITLWGSYVGFCRGCGAMRAASNALGRALCALPNEPRLWIFAANWEFKNNTNVENARNLFQRAIRVNPLCVELYVEYARFELSILANLKKSMASSENVKSENVKMEVQVKKEEEEEDDDDDDDGKKASLDLKSLSLPDNEDEGNDDEDDDDEDVKKAKKINDNDAAYIAGIIPRIVFSQACKRIPSDLTLRAEFAKLLHEFDISNDPENLLRNELINDLKANFSDSVDAHSILVDLTSKPANNSNNDVINEEEEEEEEKALEKIVRANPSKDNWEKFILRKASIFPKTPSGVLTVDSAKKISSLCDEVDTLKLASVRVYELWLTVAAAALADEALAAAVAERAIKGCPESSKLWRAHIALLARSGANSDVICAELRRAAEAVRGESEDELVKFPFLVDILRRHIDQDKFSLEKAVRDVIASIELLCSVRVARTGEAGAFAPLCYDIFREKFGRKGARRVAALFVKKTPCCSAEFCARVLDAEEPARDAAYVRDFYRVVLGPTCLGRVAPELWVRYHKFEQELGNMREAANVYQRARTILDNPSAFLDSFSGL